MRALFDLVHPADALFFCHAINRLRASGAEIRIVSRHKDVLVPLLDESRLEHMPITRAATGRWQLARELLERDARLFKVVRDFRPHVMVGFGGVAIAHIGTLTGIPSIAFYDTEHATLQTRLTLPFISEWHVPAGWTGREAKGRTFRFPGSKAAAYLHPDHFKPSPDAARAAGWDPSRDNFLVRTVEWRATHDSGRDGLSVDQLREIVGFLGERGKVHISAEGNLPDDMEPLRYRGSAVQYHHLLSHCRLQCGESITVASEAVALGVPVLLQIDREYCYIRQQEDAGLIDRLHPGDCVKEALACVLGRDQEDYRQRSRAFMTASGDLNAYIVDQINRLGGAPR
ncbi:MAG TPA: DUF354 domain-containing protein [Sphingomicrobium sp.]|nr:DUF354 domain-containing protein [Sphingomicrobium sp.]